jgi:hypothetical protein
MSFDVERLYGLLPAIHRIRDAERGGPLRAVLAVIANEVAVIEENLEQLYDDQFIETCAEWVVPYIGDLVGARTVHELDAVTSQRAEVGHAIALRRRKGTAAAVEQVARDTTGFVARAVEFFELLATTQYLNHLRLARPGWVAVRAAARLEDLATPFAGAPRNADVRRIASGRGRYGIGNVGVFLWRLQAFALTRSPAVRAGARRFLFDPLGGPVQLHARPVTESEVEHLAEPINVPLPLDRSRLARQLGDFYGAAGSLVIEVDGEVIPVERVCGCNLQDGPGADWAHAPADRFAIDPVLGRLATPAQDPEPEHVRVSFHYGFSSELGGGQYDRSLNLRTASGPIVRVPSDYATVQDALAAVAGGGVIEIEDSSRYPGSLIIPAGAQRLVIRAATGARPHLALAGDLEVTAADGADIALDGLLVSGGALRLTGPARRLELAHCTFVPGLERTAGGEARFPDAPSLIVDAPGARIELYRTISGALRVVDDATVQLTESIVDATRPDGLAYAGLAAGVAGGPLGAAGSTVIGAVHALALEEVSNSILLAAAPSVTPAAPPVWAERLQRGCVRFSYLPLESRAPRRYRCQPSLAAPRSHPELTSSRYGDPAYCQLDARTPREIQRGADDEGEMGAFHHLHLSQRETNLRIRLDEYLRFGLEAGIFYAS